MTNNEIMTPFRKLLKYFTIKCNENMNYKITNGRLKLSFLSRYAYIFKIMTNVKLFQKYLYKITEKFLEIWLRLLRCRADTLTHTFSHTRTHTHWDEGSV